MGKKRVKEKVCILHEYGAPSHYYGLEYLCKDNDIKVIYREFDVFHWMGVGIKRKDAKLFFKQFVNICFLISLPFKKPMKIVLGACPYDWRLSFLDYLTKKHTIYYHSSYTLWNDQGILSKTSAKTLLVWKSFLLNRVKHIFVVTEQAARELALFLGINRNKITIVYHSYQKIMPLQTSSFYDNYIYVGRMSEVKGVKEICDYFIKCPDKHLTLIGRGNLDSYVKKVAKENSNIQYLGFINGIENIIPHYLKSGYFILNSKRTETWEELFGLVLIEAMSTGCIPISVNHSGPKEIITHMKDGYLYREGELRQAIEYVSNLSTEELEVLKKEAIKTGQQFHAKQISNRWRQVLA